jgi:hypothetical protein
MTSAFNHSLLVEPSDAIHCLDDLFAWVHQTPLEPALDSLRVSVAFVTLQQSQHVERQQHYSNHVISLRVGQSVGSCFMAKDQISHATITACIGRSVQELLQHPEWPIRIAALDAYLSEVFAHAANPHARPLSIPAGTSTEKSLFRAQAVIDLLDIQPGQRIALIGVVNSLIMRIHERGGICLPCDYTGGITEWGEPITPDMEQVLEQADAILATGMTFADRSFDRILSQARRRKIPLVLFAQTGSAIAPRFLGNGVTGVSAEPYPFFWLTGGPTQCYLYRLATSGEPQRSSEHGAL